MKRINYFLALILFGIIFASCTKQGPTGPQGAQGNANVTSNSYTITSWTTGNYFYYTNLSVPALTSSILNSGAIEVYWSIDGGTSWNRLPKTVEGPENCFMSYLCMVGQVRINFTWNSGNLNGDPYTYFGTESTFRVVCIAPQ